MLIDYFDLGKSVLNDGDVTPRWKCEYTGFGSVQINKKLILQPQVNEEGTSAAFVLTQDAFHDFDISFDMRTVSQNRSSPNAWEVAWFMFRFTDDTHHYYTMLKSNGGFELGKKDYYKVDSDKVRTPDGTLYTKSQDQQQYLFTSEGHSFSFNTWYHFRVKTSYRNIKVWIDNVLMCDITDDGTIGFDSITEGNAQWSSVMTNGRLGFYVEDCKGEFDNVVVV